MRNSKIITMLTSIAVLASSQLSLISYASAINSLEKNEYLISVSDNDKETLAQRMEKAGIEIVRLYKNFDLIAVRADGRQASGLGMFSGVKSVQPSLKYLPAEEEDDEAVTDEDVHDAEDSEAAEVDEAVSDNEDTETDDAEEGSDDSYSGPYSTGIWTVRRTIESEYDGTGTVAAVIDSGFDADHYEFVLSDDETAKFDIEYIGDIFDDLNAAEGADSVMDVYHSPKLPFVFDYGDMDADVYEAGNTHGTHVAGIIGGNNKSGSETGFWGIAPEAQLVLMKVQETGGDGYLSDSSIFAALDDALTLKVDSINLSLGAVSGFTDEADYEPAYKEVLGKLKSEEITVYYSAGNESSMGPNSLFSYYFGIEDNPTYAPDRSTVGSNATYSEVMAVASAVPDYHSTANHIILKDGTVIDYVEDSNEDFSEQFRGKSFEIAVIPGIGAEEDFADIDAAGKMALIQRGDITFTEKLYNAENAGAIGAIVYGNSDDGEYVTMAVDEGQIPAAFILMDDGEYIAEDPGTVKITYEFILKEETEAGTISSFTSWGPNGMLEIKPDVTGYGTDIYSALPDGDGGNMSGTSMSTPYLTGVSLLMRQMLNETGDADPETDGVDNLADRINNLLMSSAEVICDDIGVEFSPRLQGAGLAIADNALSSKTEILDPVTKKAKISLGDKLSDTFSVTFELVNLSDDDRTYYIGASALAEDYYSD
nr:S8 family serine peptidase [Clostridiales bacterium]